MMIKLWQRTAYTALSASLCFGLFAGYASDKAAADRAGSGLAAAPPTVCLDPGHQMHADSGPEPIGPGSAETKPRVAGGTQGVVTKTPEYVRTLEASLRMRDKLAERGYRVVMTRETNDVDLSNKERAELCNASGGQLFLRIHADGDASSRTQGLSVLYPSPDSPFTPTIYEGSRMAAESLLDMLIAQTGARSRGSVPRGDLTGFNWSDMPTVLVEMGFMTNPDEDRQLADPQYQEQIAAGIADGVDRYFRQADAYAASVPLNAPVMLPHDTDLYDRGEGGFTEAGAAISAQQVMAYERIGHWYRVATWLGDRWLFAPEAFADRTELTDTALELVQTTEMTADPIAGSPVLGALAPQTVRAVAKWSDWYVIRSWLGEVWIHF